MSNDVVISVENLSKRYRIGAKEEGYKTFREALIDGFTAPIRNLKRLRKLTKFEDNPSKEHRAKSIESNSTLPAPCPVPSSEDDVIWALRDVSFEVQPGEVLGIIGRNGAGKTTLLKILSRITEPTTGEARIYGRVSSLLEVGTGFHPELTGRENIYLNGTILGMRRAEIDRKFDEIVDFAEIEKFIDTPVKRYSSGMYVRLAFSVAAHLEPEILLVDEVLAVGDAAFQKKCLGKMSDVAKEGRTVLFVSHNMAAMQKLCTRAILLNHGQVVTGGKTNNVISKYLMESTNLAQISLSERRDRQGSGDIRFTSVVLQNEKGENLSSFHSGQNVKFVFRYKNNLSRDLKNLHLAIGIDNQIGGRIVLLSSEVTNEVFSTVPIDVNSIEIYIERLPLTSGRYGFTIYATINGVVADWIQNAGFFDVEAGDYYGTGNLPPVGQGNFLFDYRFKLGSVRTIV